MNRTPSALLVDPQVDFPSTKGATWKLAGKSVEAKWEPSSSPGEKTLRSLKPRRARRILRVVTRTGNSGMVQRLLAAGPCTRSEHVELHRERLLTNRTPAVDANRTSGVA
jgi:hypothetical protein